jgi:glycosyltransferase involved in cell wall biosynthesis
MTIPLVSVAIICYNQEDFIEETILSAVHQDYERLEVIVADDGSSDRTPEIIRRLAEQYPDRIVPLLDGPNLGITGNSNRSIWACKGKYIALMGGDDIFLPSKIRAQVEWLEQDPQHTLCAHSMIRFMSATGELLVQYDEWKLVEHGSGPEAFLTKGMIYLPSSIMVRRDAIPAKGFDERLPYASDRKFVVDVLSGGGKFRCLRSRLGKYRLHEKNVSIFRRQECFKDWTLMWTLIEIEHPRFVHLCRTGRAYVYYREGITLCGEGYMEKAREMLYLSFVTAPELFISKIPFHYLLTYVSPENYKAIFKLRQRLL